MKKYADVNQRRFKSLEKYSGTGHLLPDASDVKAAGISSNLRIENQKEMEIERGQRLKGIK